MIMEAMRPDPWIKINMRDLDVITQISIDRHEFLYFYMDITFHAIYNLLIIKVIRPDTWIIIHERNPNMIW